MLFPLWSIEVLVYGGIALCGLGALALILFLILDNRNKSIW